MRVNRIAAALMALIMVLGLGVTAWAADMNATFDYNSDDVVSGGTFSAILTFSDNVADANGKLLYTFSSGNSFFSVSSQNAIADDSGNTVPNKALLKIKVAPGQDYSEKTIDIQAKKKSDSSVYSVKLNVGGTPVDKLFVGERAVVDDTALVYIGSYNLPSSVHQNQIFKVSLNFIKTGTYDDLDIKFLTLEDSNFTIVNSDGSAKDRFEVTTDDTNTVYLRVSPNVAKGTYQVAFKAIVEYTKKDETGNTVLMRTIVSLSPINVNVNVPDEESSSSSSESTVDPILTPHLVITGFSTAGADLADNENFTFSVSFKNTSRSVAVQNVLITITLPEGVSMPFASTNFYVEQVGAGKSETLTFTLKGKKNIEAGVSNLGIAFSYQYYFDKQYLSGTDSETVGLSFGTGEDKEKEDRFEISNIATPDMLYPGQEDYLTITVINKGKEQIMNVQAKIESDNLSNSGASEYYGLLDVNKKDDIELPMVAINGGNVMGKVTITYELSDGTEKTMVKDFTAYAEEMSEPTYDPSIDDPGMIEPEQSAGLAWWAWAFIIVGGAVVIIVAAVVLKKRAAKKKQALIDAEDSADD